MQTLLTDAPYPVEIEEIPVMICPFCSHHIAATWQTLSATTDQLGKPTATFASSLLTVLPMKEGAPTQTITNIDVQWLICQNQECRQIVVQVTRREYPNTKPAIVKTESWFAVPKVKALPVVDPLIPETTGKDYQEACIILDDSPRMSSVLSRRILADLLKDYTGAGNFSLAARIDAFIKDTQHPSRLRDNLHYLRAMGDFSAHTQQDQDQKIIDVTKEEAEWTLKVIADLLDYFIVAPKKDEALRKTFDKKIQDAGRKPLDK